MSVVLWAAEQIARGEEPRAQPSSPLVYRPVEALPRQDVRPVARERGREGTGKGRRRPQTAGAAAVAAALPVALAVATGSHHSATVVLALEVEQHHQLWQ